MAVDLVVACPLPAQARERVLYVSRRRPGDRTAGARSRPDAFVVREDGIAREVLRVDAGHLARCRSRSSSTTARRRRRHITDLRRALTAFFNGIDGLGPIALVTVADRPTIARRLHDDRRRTCSTRPIGCFTRPAAARRCSTPSATSPRAGQARIRPRRDRRRRPPRTRSSVTCTITRRARRACATAARRCTRSCWSIPHGSLYATTKRAIARRCSIAGRANRAAAHRRPDQHVVRAAAERSGRRS